MFSFSGKKFRMIGKELKGKHFNKIWNSRGKFEIPALLQGSTMCLVLLIKIQNDQTRTQGGVAF